MSTVSNQVDAAMPTVRLIGSGLPGMPWQDRPADHPGVVWRYHDNPVIPRNPFPTANSVFNSAVVPYQNGYAGVFRCDDTQRNMQLHAGFSPDGLDWSLDPERIRFVSDDPDIGRWAFGYDPRVCWIDDRYYVTWCNGYHGPTIGMAWTTDFRTFHQRENAFLIFNRNGVLFPRRIGDDYVMLSRPSDNGHTPFGDIFLSRSPDLEHWGRHRFVMGAGSGWQSTKIGAGPVPLETSEGWLLFYHGVLTSCNGFVYSMGASLLDLDEPWNVIYRSAPYLLAPWEPYECVGDVPNVVFPCAALADADSGRIAIYYGCADTVTGLCFCRVDEVIDFLRHHSMV